VALGPIAVAGLSARWLAESAQRAGLRAVALDLFGDLDTQRAAAQWQPIGDPAALQIDIEQFVATLEQLRRASGVRLWIAGAGFEGIPDALVRGARVVPLAGNAPETVAQVRAPDRFFPLLDRLGIGHPAVSSVYPNDAAAWLLKDAGGSGGWHIRHAQSGDGNAPRRYFQRVAAGRSLSVLFVADRKRAARIAVSEQLIAPVGARPFVYGGAIGPIALAPPVLQYLDHRLDAIVAATGLVGLGSLDFLLDGERCNVLEVNPRPSATMALYDADFARGLLQAHLDACGAGSLPAPRVTRGVRGARIVFAGAAGCIDARTCAQLAAMPWCHDVPCAGTRFEAGDPLCSVSAAGDDVDTVRARLAARARQLRELAETLQDVERCPSN
jgi:predicted ATP-grasp superfamily ATP-dependent carboligase